MGLDIDLYTPKIDIGDDSADDIIIEITGLKSINKFIGLEDTPLYYDNGKFFKVENNKIVYTDIQWKDISGDISESPEIVAVISDLVNEVASDIVDEHINLHNINEEAHPYIQDVINQNYITLDTKIDNTKEELSEDIQQETLARIEVDATLQNNINTLTNNLSTETENRISADNLLRNDIDSISGELAQEIINRQTQDNLLQQQITSNYNSLDDKIDTEISNRTSADTTLQNNIDTEISTRQNADNNLQSQIDAIVSSSDVFDIVGTYTELQDYDIITVPVNDIIKVLVDSTHNNTATYYRCVETGSVKSWSYIGAEGAYYTKSESDNRFVAKTITVNGQPLSSNITLTASDVGALPNTTTIPTKTSDLTNDSGFITNIVNNLTNYYLKSETYTKTEVQQLIASIPQFSVVVVQTLPVTGERMVLYLVPKDGEAPDVYNEYIWVEDEDEFELLGSTAVDLTGYATETYVDTGLDTKVSKSGDSMTGALTTDSAIYLTNISNSVHTSVSKIYFGSANSPTNYICANTGGAFGIYNNNRQGITCYPGTNLFPDATSGTMDLGRSNNKWRHLFISGTLYGANSNISITDLISGANAGNTAVQPADLANYQPLLVSGTNIKTINNETVLGSGNIDIQSSTVAYGTSSTAGNVAEKEVSIPEITELNVGQILYIKPSASATVANLTIKLNNFTAYPIRYNNSAITTTTDDLVWNQNIVSQFIFDGTYWQFAGRGYDNNSTYTLNVLFDRGNFVSGSGTYAITRYSLCLQKPDMTWEKVTNTEEDYSLATNKTVNTHGFLLNGEMLYYSNSTVLTNGAVSSANTMYRQNSGFDIRYSMNITGTGYTAGDYIYLVGTIGVDGLFYLDSTQWWTNTLPNTNDGKIYVKIGKYVSGVTVTLELEHPAYYHNGTRICEYQSASNKQDTLVSGTNIKTINNQSLLGSGDITIQGGGAVDSVNGQTGTVVLTASDVGALSDSTVIPTVNNPTITFTQGGTTKGTITLNQSNNQTIALDAGGSGGGGTWGSITGTLSDQTDLQNALNAKLNVSDVTEYTAQEVETLWGSI